MASIQTISAALELAQALQNLTPEALKEAADMTYSLGHQGEERLKKAHETISQASEIEKTLEIKKGELAATQAKVDSAFFDFDREVETHKANVEKHEADVAAFNDEESTHAYVVKAFEDKKKGIEASLQIMFDKEKELDIRVQEIAKVELDIENAWEAVRSAEAALKAKADKFKAHTDELLG